MPELYVHLNSNMNLLDVSPKFNFSGENTYLSLRTWSSQEIVQGGKLLLSKFHMCSQEAAVMSSGL